MAPYEALYGRKCRTPLYWTELSENKLHGVDLIKDTKQKVKVIRDSLKATSDRQKSYVDLKRKDIEFETGDKVFLKVSPWKKIEIKSDMTYEEEPIRILVHEVKELRNKKIPLVKVLWRRHRIEEATC
ncbi:DNA/RNA polymerases superfamily protein [Gossypium australe]|uniref:DNA/RNA polymerases superfamily protein n=1 Tax=Gossypium australe TaxID=47621 RepID=A0A5B6V9J5_9ROSI|nr:DNA/RNA polymerases superfamily protein [Gossypium australe]